MPRYIDADALKIKIADENILKHDDRKSFYVFLNDFPTADVQETKHGHWIQKDVKLEGIAITQTHITEFFCSECGRKENKKQPYCNCGAKMEGENYKQR